MAALPSFIELMASLGLDNDNPKPLTPIIVRTRDRSHSCSSCSSTSSSLDGRSPSIPSPNLSSLRIDSDRRPAASRLRAVRYSPYISASASARQCSALSLTHSQHDQEQSSRSPSPILPSPRITRRPSPPHLSKLSKRERPAITPISSYREYVERPEVIIPPSLVPMSFPTVPPIRH